MPYETYPEPLPWPRVSTGQSAERRRLSRDGGPRVAGVRQHARLSNQTLVFRLSFEQAGPWQAWWTDALLQGGKWFLTLWPHPSGEIVPRRFLAPPQWMLVAGFGWDVSVDCECLGGDAVPTAFVCNLAPYVDADGEPAVSVFADHFDGADGTSLEGESPTTGTEVWTTEETSMIYFESSAVCEGEHADNSYGPFTVGGEDRIGLHVVVARFGELESSDGFRIELAGDGESNLIVSGESDGISVLRGYGEQQDFEAGPFIWSVCTWVRISVLIELSAPRSSKVFIDGRLVARSDDPAQFFDLSGDLNFSVTVANEDTLKIVRFARINVSN